MSDNPQCFVIQPFDGAGFDDRYDQVLEGAIQQAGLEPYRVDQDPSAHEIIKNIEDEIRNSQACIADISTDNPNVWYEVGFAYAVGHDVILISEKERAEEGFPFDIQHRRVTGYEKNAPQDFEDLKEEVRERLAAIVQQKRQIPRIADRSSESGDGLQSFEATVLAIAVSYNGRDTPCSRTHLSNDMNDNGFTDTASGLALKSLTDKGFLETREGHHRNYQYEEFVPTDRGFRWAMNHSEELGLRYSTSGESDDQNQSDGYSESFDDDDIPF